MIINIGIHLISLMGVELKTCISSLVYSNERSMLRHSDFFFKIDFTYTPKLNKRVPFDKEIVLANKKNTKINKRSPTFLPMFFSFLFIHISNCLFLSISNLVQKILRQWRQEMKENHLNLHFLRLYSGTRLFTR